MPKLLAGIHKRLMERADIALIEPAPDDRIVGIQIRRVWRTIVHNPESMSPHEQSFWYYFGQFFCIMEPVVNAAGQQLKTQRDFAAGLRGAEALVVFPKAWGDVLDALGPEPRDVEEYVRRQPHKTVAPMRQPTPYVAG